MPFTQLNRDLLLKFLEGTATSIDDLDINYTALGSGTTAFTLADTVLDVEEFRKTTTLKTRSTDTLRTITTILDTEANTFTINELGTFANGTGTVDTGNLLSRVVFTDPLTKTSSNALNIVHRYKVVY